MQVVVLGMHRSGTSAISRVLNLMGVYFGGEGASIGRNEENPKGFWERRDVRFLNDTILFGADCDWDHVSNLDLQKIPDNLIAEYSSSAADIVLNLDAHRPWFVKEPRLCVLFPIWRRVLETPVCVHIHRNPLDTATSLNVRNDIPIDVGLALWEFYNSCVLAYTVGIPRLLLRYEDLLSAPSPTVLKLRETFLEFGVSGLRLPTDKELAIYLDPDLRRQRSSDSALRAAASSAQLELYGILRTMDGADSKVVTGPSEACLNILREYEETVDLHGRVKDANVREQRRAPSNLELELKLRKHDLAHALATSRSLDDVTSKLVTANERARSLEEQRSELQGANRHLEGANRQLSAKVTELEHGNNDVTSKLATANERATSLAEQMSELQGANRHLEGANRQLSANVTELEHGNNDVTSKLATANERATSLAGQMSELQGERGNLEGANRELSAKVTELEHGNNDVTSKLATANERATSLAEQMSELQGERGNLAGANRQLSATVTELERGNNDVTSKLATANERATSLAEQMSELQGERGNLEGANRQLSAKVTELERGNNDVTSKLATANERARSLAEQMSELQGERGNLAGANRQLSATVTELERGNNDVTSKLATANERATSLAEQMSELQGERGNLEGANRQLSAKVTELERGNNDVTSKLATANERARSLAEQRSELQGERGNLEGANRQLSAKVTELEYGNRELTTAARDLGQDVERAIEDHAAQQRRNRERVKQLNVELLGLKGHFLRLRAEEAHFCNRIESLLRSRRWRCGDTLFSFRHRILLRTLPATAATSFATIRSTQLAKQETIDRLLASSKGTSSDLGRCVAQMSISVNSLLQSDPRVEIELAEVLWQRSSEIQLHRTMVKDREMLVAQLVEIAEALITSRRWRFGNLVFSLARRLILFSSPPTVGDSLSRSIEEHRASRSRASESSADASKRRQPVPQPIPGANGDLSTSTSTRGWLLRNTRRAFTLGFWLSKGQFARATRASHPYYRRYVPRKIRRVVPTPKRERGANLVDHANDDNQDPPEGSSPAATFLVSAAWWHRHPNAARQIVETDQTVLVIGHGGFSAANVTKISATCGRELALACVTTQMTADIAPNADPSTDWSKIFDGPDLSPENDTNGVNMLTPEHIARELLAYDRTASQ